MEISIIAWPIQPAPQMKPEVTICLLPEHSEKPVWRKNWSIAMLLGTVIGSNKYRIEAKMWNFLYKDTARQSMLSKNARLFCWGPVWCLSSLVIRTSSCVSVKIKGHFYLPKGFFCSLERTSLAWVSRQARKFPSRPLSLLSQPAFHYFQTNRTCPICRGDAAAFFTGMSSE